MSPEAQKPSRSPEAAQKPIEKTLNVIRELKTLGADVNFTVYPMAGHDSWTETYADPDLYEWFLARSTRRGK